MSEEPTSIKSLFISGLLVLLGVVFGGIVKGYMDIQLSEKQLYSELILKSLDSTDPDERYRSLKFMLDTNLIQNSEIKDGLQKYLITKQGDKKGIPNISTGSNRWRHTHGDIKHIHKYDSATHSHTSVPKTVEDYDYFINKIKEDRKLILNGKKQSKYTIDQLDEVLEFYIEARENIIQDERDKLIHEETIKE